MSAVLNPLAEALDDALERDAPEVLASLSHQGRRLYFPRGILSQSAEAKARGTRFNATIGIATERGEPMHLTSILRMVDGLDPADAFPYAPPAGRASLRERWRVKLLEENPALGDKVFGMPIVTSAITHGMSIAGDLFLDPGDVVVTPDQLWGNYRLAYEVRNQARIVTFPFYAGDGFNVDGLQSTLESVARDHDKVVVVLNFPNNPTGYMPTDSEGDAIVSALQARARGGSRVVAICDDAYFGLFYHLGTPSMTESLFGRLTNLHPNLLAIKLDGATKELFVWGLRCGFLTFGPGRRDTAKEVAEALDAKVRGHIRATISNSPHLSQSIVEAALESESIAEERAAKRDVLKARAERVDEVARRPRYADSWEVYPFNSGYFMLIRLKGVEAEKLRTHLLDAYQTGLIATRGSDMRVAFSCLELEEIEPLFETIHRAIGDLRDR